MIGRIGRTFKETKSENDLIENLTKGANICKWGRPG